MSSSSLIKGIFIGAVMLACIGSGAAADEAGNRIARLVDATEAVDSARMVMTMTIRQSDRAEPRIFRVLSLENAEGDSHVEFLEPRTVRGLRILSRGTGSWVFFPSTGRVRKLGGSARSGSVSGVGGDFSYSDLGAGSWASDYDFSLTGEDSGTWTLEGVRRSPESGYDAVRLRVDKSTNKFTSCLFSLSSEGGWYKELSCGDFKTLDGILVATRLVMRNLKTGSSTEVLVNEARFGQSLEDRLFDPGRFHQ